MKFIILITLWAMELGIGPQSLWVQEQSCTEQWITAPSGARISSGKVCYAFIEPPTCTGNHKSKRIYLFPVIPPISTPPGPVVAPKPKLPEEEISSESPVIFDERSRSSSSPRSQTGAAAVVLVLVLLIIIVSAYYARRAQRQREDYDNKIQFKNRAISGLREQISMLLEDLQTKRETLVSLKQTLALKVEEVSFQNQEISAQAQKITDQGQEISTQAQEIITQAKEIEELKNQAIQLEAQIEKVRKQNLLNVLLDDQDQIASLYNNFVQSRSLLEDVIAAVIKRLELSEEIMEGMDTLLKALHGMMAEIQNDGQGNSQLVAPIPDDPYEFLGIDPAEAQQKEVIKKQRVQLLMQFHPDNVHKFHLEWITTLYNKISEEINARSDEVSKRAS